MNPLGGLLIQVWLYLWTDFWLNQELLSVLCISEGSHSSALIYTEVSRIYVDLQVLCATVYQFSYLSYSAFVFNEP